MTSQVEILVDTQPKALVLHLQSEAKAALKRLEAIVETVGRRMFNEYKDPLTCQLLEWSANVLPINLSTEMLNEGVFKEKVKYSLSELRNILMDLFSKTILTDPILIVETGWTCEQLLIDSIEPNLLTYHGKTITKVTHEFAKEMLKWAASISMEPSADSQAVIKPITSHQDEDFESKKRSFINFYQIKVTQAMAMFKLGRFMEKVTEDSEMLSCLMELIEQRAEEHARRSEQKAAESQKATAVRLDALEQNSKGQLDQLQAVATEAWNKMEAAEKEVLRLKIESLRQQGEILSLGDAYRHRLQEVEELKKKNKSKRFGCTVQ